MLVHIQLRVEIVNYDDGLTQSASIILVNDCGLNWKFKWDGFMFLFLEKCWLKTILGIVHNVKRIKLQQKWCLLQGGLDY